MTTTTTTTTLRRWNVTVGTLHLIQAVVVVIIANDFAIPVISEVQTGPPGSGDAVTKEFFSVRFGFAVAAFLALAAADHLLMAAPGVRRWYEGRLARGVNPARWIEYSFSASIMLVLIALLTGINDLYALIGLFALTASMILFGWLMERSNRPGEPVDWTPFVFGCFAGAVPWVAIAIALANAEAEGDGVPGFVYGIFVSLFVLFNCFALNQWLQYRGRGRFADYLYGERAYLILSLGAKSALAWQVYAGTLAD